MSDHQIKVRYADEGKHVAVCSCGRWKSNLFLDPQDADDAGTAHQIRGDLHNRAIAAAHRGTSPLKTQLKWYEEQAADMMNTAAQRQQWQILADELRPRVTGGPPQGDDEALF